MFYLLSSFNRACVLRSPVGLIDFEMVELQAAFISNIYIMLVLIPNKDSKNVVRYNLTSRCAGLMLSYAFILLQKGKAGRKFTAAMNLFVDIDH